MTTRQGRGLQGFADGQADGFMWVGLYGKNIQNENIQIFSKKSF